MRITWLVLIGLLIGIPVSAVMPPPGNEIPAADRKLLEDGAAALGREIESLRKSLAGKPELLALLPDVQIYHKAVDWPLRYRELIDVKKAKAALATGMERAKALAAGNAPWLTAGGPRAYVSSIDGSIQPYVVVMPAGYDTSKKGPYRLDLFFHGRAEKMMELEVVTAQRLGDAPTSPPDDKRFLVYTYGRYCCANKFAGEIDTLEVIEAMKKQYAIDEDRIVITGFSMGGAAAWHHAVHYTDRWAAASPGAGFCETRIYQKMDASGEWEALPAWQKKLMHLYDCPDYAINLSMLPIIAYAGTEDPQRASGDIMEKALADRGQKLERILGEKTGHKYEPGAKKELAARLDAYAAKGRNRVPKQVRFETWTLRYNRMFWVTVDGLEEHWERARVEGQLSDTGVTLKTSNVSALSVQFNGGDTPFAAGASPSVTIDGVAVPGGPAVVANQAWTDRFVKANGTWSRAPAKPQSTLKKVHGLQGPIDDAFLSAFVMVRPTGKPLNEKVGKWATAEADYAASEWRKIFRGDAPVKKDSEITDADIFEKNLILFGDPSSNAVLAIIAEKLPIRWSDKEIMAGGKTCSADDHGVILIYPNPLNRAKYVVLNSGFTFRQADHRTNSRQLAKLPDWAVVDLNTPADDKWPGKIEAAGFFDERWQFKKD